jgi:hypothetical protein
MNANPHDDAEPSPRTGPPSDHELDGRYASFTNDDGSVVVYDETNDRAWIESDDAVTVADMA